MRTTLLVKPTLFVVPVLLVATVMLPLAVAADQQSAKRAGRSSAVTDSGIAAGAVEDTLAACMARIPKDASIGQRMIAEQGCMRDESDRTQFLPSPGRAAATESRR